MKQPDRFHKQAIEQSTELCRTTVMPNLKGTIELGFDTRFAQQGLFRSATISLQFFDPAAKENALQVAASAGPVAQRMKQSVSMGMGFVNGPLGRAGRLGNSHDKRLAAPAPTGMRHAAACHLMLQITRSVTRPWLARLRGFNTIMPAALALAPALLRGALKAGSRSCKARQTARESHSPSPLNPEGEGDCTSVHNSRFRGNVLQGIGNGS